MARRARGAVSARPGRRRPDATTVRGRVRMLSQAQQERLTRVGPGTPMGTLLRRYWMPVAASIEIPSGATRAVRLLGEDLVLFRSTGGARAPRRALPAPRHVAGRWLRRRRRDPVRIPWLEVRGDRGLSRGVRPDRPGPARRARTRAYRADELGGLVFAYLGPEPAPLLPRWDLMVWPSVLRDIGRATIPCNWLQIMENSVDPIHLEWLHGHHLAAVRRRLGRPAPTQYPRRHVEIGFDRFPLRHHQAPGPRGRQP